MDSRGSRAVLAVLTTVLPLVACGCADEGFYHLRIVFEDAAALERIAEVTIWALEPGGVTCEQLVAGDVDPDDIEETKIQSRLTVSFPQVASSRLNRVPAGYVIFFAEGQDANLTSFLRGCTLHEVVAGSSVQVTVELRRYCESDADCDDDSDCTSDLCTAAVCYNTPFPDGLTCDDGLYCTDPDICAGGYCRSGERDCAATGDPCNDGICDEAGDTCNASPVTDGTHCDDLNMCSGPDTCQGGVCEGTEYTCDDSNVCTDDDCNGDGTCSYADKTGPCDDGIMCTENDVCSGGICGGAPNDSLCDDMNVCTDDACDAAMDCTTTNNAVSCPDDGIFCTDDICSGGVCTHPEICSWWDPNWNVRTALTFDTRGITQSLSDCPVLVVLRPSRIDYALTRNAGQDIRFVDADGTTVLLHEIEDWDETGDSFVWVSVPTVDADSVTDHIWLYFGNPTASDTQDPGNLWDPSYVGVWHLNQDPGPGNTGDILDSSGNGFDGTADATMTSADLIDAPIGHGVRVDEIDDEIVVGDHPAFELPEYTWSLWVYGDSVPTLSANCNVIINADSQFNFAWHHGDSSFLQASAHYDGAWRAAQVASPLAARHWYFLTSTYDGATLRVYLDGAPEGSVAHGTPMTEAGVLSFGNDPDDNCFSGRLDEVRILSVARSPGWIAAQHRSQIDVLITYGPPETYR